MIRSSSGRRPRKRSLGAANPSANGRAGGLSARGMASIAACGFTSPELNAWPRTATWATSAASSCGRGAASSPSQTVSASAISCARRSGAPSPAAHSRGSNEQGIVASQP